uniref:Tuberoinfundibular peptide of 39 residues n=1 Tax=Periophthalmus magnuspinnatus TaxID=409849 RepID=A0A3B4BAT2_9GOBI
LFPPPIFSCYLSTAFPQPGITFTSDSSDVFKQDSWDVFPSVTLSDWLIQMMSSPSLREGLMVLSVAWLLVPDGPWPMMLPFRERTKLLTSMERQKWLNSYMQKLLVISS